MKQDEAIELVEAWRQLHDGGHAPQDAQAHLWRALCVLLPDDIVAAALRINDAAAIVGVADGSLLEVTVTLEEGSVPAVCVRRRAISPTATNVVLNEVLEDLKEHPVVRGTARLRAWTFDPGVGRETLSWETRQVLFGGFGSERVVDRPERLARHMASAFGWSIPSIDQSGPDWPDP